MRDNPDDLANQKIKRAITKLKNIVGCINKTQEQMHIKELIQDTIKDLKKQD